MLVASLSAIASLLKGQSVGNDIQCRGVSIDSRHIAKDALFFAIEGARFDGHAFVDQAKKQGAAAAIVHKHIATDLPCVVVENTRVALRDLAEWWRVQQPVALVAVTGSCGKTTTKNLMATIFKQCKNVHANRGTLNNDYGVPLTLLELTPEHEVAVVEMGANHVGEIAYLSRMARPNVAVITGVAPVHVEGFGSLENIAAAKGEIFQGLGATGVGVLNRDDAFFAYWQTLLVGKTIISFGLSEQADIYVSDVCENATGTVEFYLHFPSISLPISLPLLGKHNVLNALAAAAACYALGVAPTVIQAGLQMATPESKRLVKSVAKNGCTIIDDSYNANPSSFAAALKVLSLQSGEKIVVMGDMAELGNEAKQYHRDLAQQAKQCGVQAIYAIGDLSQETVKAFGKNAYHFAEQAQLIDRVKAAISKNSCLLVKGSRCMQMEKVVEALM
jgi:UDP-N-acetylmuramoyl-tripeptide--D-alanyl-D-alanine ligase